MLQKNEVPAHEVDRAVEHLDSCLGCLGCQTACPSGVQYGRLLDQARPLIAQHRPSRVRAIMRFAFSHLLPNYPRLRMFGKLLRAAQAIGLDKLPSRWTWLANLIGAPARWSEFLPAVPRYKPLPKQSWISGEKRGEVQLFGGCVMDIFYNDVNHACVQLLANQRQIVKVPEQTCCGALAFHAGEIDIAKDLAKRNIELLEHQTGDIVVTAAGCGAMLKEYGHLLHDEPTWRERAEALSSRICDVTEFLAEHEFSSAPKAVPCKVAYHAACHLAHAQHVRQAPAELLQRIAGVQTVPLEEAEHCCGSAGIYNIMHTDMSMEVLARKMDNVARTGADIVVTTNPGCLLQLEKGLRDAGSTMKAMHLVTLLEQAYLSQ
jgi:glycolate oxidase iron-sulfur subunit